MRKGSDAYDNMGMQLEGWLDGHRLWPCLNPDCHRKVDPDAQDQYCSKSCANAVISGKVPNRDYSYAAARKATGGWRPAPIDQNLWPWRGR